jgi:nucleotide-binding universal stress UspA family protein
MAEIDLQVESASDFRRILVVVNDGSDADQLATATARLASHPGSEVLVVHVSDVNACCGAGDHPALHEHEHALLQSLVDGLCLRGVRARSELRRTTSGRVAEHLLDAAEQWHAELLVAGVGRLGRLRGRPWRRVLAKLTDDGSCPVFLLPRPQVRPATHVTRAPRS